MSGQIEYNEIEKAKALCKLQVIILIMGDMNAKVGDTQVEDIVGKHGLGKSNKRGQKWVTWCVDNNQVITNTWFENHPRRKWTWKSPDQNTKNQIDYITVTKHIEI